MPRPCRCPRPAVLRVRGTDGAERARAEATKTAYQKALSAAGKGEITTELLAMPVFYPAEEYHQQYLAKNPNGYCGLGGTGVCLPG